MGEGPTVAETFQRALPHARSRRRTACYARSCETNADTEFGRRHGFGGITTFKEFQERVPIAGYEDLEPYITGAR